MLTRTNSNIWRCVWMVLTTIVLLIIIVMGKNIRSTSCWHWWCVVVTAPSTSIIKSLISASWRWQTTPRCSGVMVIYVLISRREELKLLLIIYEMFWNSKLHNLLLIYLDEYLEWDWGRVVLREVLPLPATDDVAVSREWYPPEDFPSSPPEAPNVPLASLL